MLNKIVLIALYTLTYIVRSRFERRYGKNPAVVQRDQVRHKRLAIAVKLSYIVPTLIWALTNWFSAGQLESAVPLTLFGVVLFLFSLAFLNWIHLSLGEFWSETLEIRTQHRLLTSGPYRLIRHPMYTSVLLFIISGLMISTNLTYFAIQFTIWLALVTMRIPAEEKMMAEAFPAEYPAYQTQTKRLIPFVF